MFVQQTNKLFFSATSFYPGRGDTTTTHPLASIANFNTDDQVFYNPNMDDHDIETEEDDDDDDEIVELALKNPAKFAQVMATEVSLWLPLIHLYWYISTAAYVDGFG